MKKQLLFLASTALMVTATSQIVNAQSCPIVPFAVVELFTSQGCSSCPPADAALNTVIAAEKTSGRNVICIEEHVHYWDYLGWVDPFGDTQFSPRQGTICTTLGVVKGTPEIFVNGKVQANTTASGINSVIASQLAATATTATAGVCLTLQTPVSTPTLTVAYEVSGSYSGSNLIVCLIEDNKVTKPTSGENNGVTLNESGVSRKFIVTPLTSAMGTVNIVPPANCVRSKSQIVAYVQNPTNLQIKGATRGIDLGTATTGIQNIESTLEVNVYPNPTTSIVTVEGVTNSDRVYYSLYNVLGTEIRSGNISATGNNFSGKIQVSDIANGMYFLKVTDGDTSFTKKINKQ